MQALKPYRVLASVPDTVLDEFVRLTARLFDMPVALISLVEEAEVAFKASYGMDVPARVSRQESMCSVAILHEETSVFEDLKTQPCELVEPMLVEKMNMRFYAGHPLQTPEKANIGTLCVIGREIGFFSTEDRLLLKELADVVADLLRLRVALHNTTGTTPVQWISLYEDLDQYLNRLDTLKELAAWEDNPDSPASLAYQQSMREEADVLLHVFRKKVAGMLAQLQ